MAQPATAQARDDLPEFTLRAAVAGIVFGLLFGAANAYLGLRVGLTVSTSIPIAVLTVAFFKSVRGDPRYEATVKVLADEYAPLRAEAAKVLGR